MLLCHFLVGTCFMICAKSTKHMEISLNLNLLQILNNYKGGFSTSFWIKLTFKVQQKHRETQINKRVTLLINWVVMETLTGSPGRPLGPTSPSSPYKQNNTSRTETDYQQNHRYLFLVPALRPLRWVLGVPVLLSRPAAIEEWSSEGTEYLQ